MAAVSWIDFVMSDWYDAAGRSTDTIPPCDDGVLVGVSGTHSGGSLVLDRGQIAYKGGKLSGVAVEGVLNVEEFGHRAGTKFLDTISTVNINSGTMCVDRNTTLIMPRSCPFNL
jgi:hypothetical protein